MKNMYHIIRLFAHLREFVPEIVLLWLKNRNQRVHTGGLMRGWAYTRRAYIWSDRSVKEKVGLSAEGAYTWRRGAYRRRNTVLQDSIWCQIMEKIGV